MLKCLYISTEKTQHHYLLTFLQIMFSSYESQLKMMFTVSKTITDLKLLILNYFQSQSQNTMTNRSQNGINNNKVCFYICILLNILLKLFTSAERSISSIPTWLQRKVQQFSYACYILISRVPCLKFALLTT